MKEGKIARYKKPSLVFLLLIPVLLIVFRCIIGFNGLYGQDAHEYLRFTAVIKDYLPKGMIPHSFHWPVLYPLLGAMLSYIFSSDLALQLISISAFSGTLYLIHRTISLLNPASEGKLGYVLLLGMLSAYLLRLGVCVMSDMLAMFFITAALFNIIRCEREPKIKNLFLVILFSSMAFLTREPSGLILLIPILRFAYFLILGKGSKIFFVLILIAIPFLGLVYFCRKLQVDHISEMFSEWSFKNYFRNEYGTPENGFQHYRFLNIIFILLFFIHPGYSLLSGVLLFFVKRSDMTEGKFYFFILPILIYLFFLAGFMIQNVRLNTLVLPLWLISLFPAYSRFTEFLSLKRISLGLFVSIVLITQSVLFYFGFNDFYDQNKLERNIAAYILEKYPNGKIVAFGMGSAMRSYGNYNSVEGLWEPILIPEMGIHPLFLIQTEKFEQQWKERDKKSIWQEYKSFYSPIKVHTFAYGWDLYESK